MSSVRGRVRSLKVHQYCPFSPITTFRARLFVWRGDSAFFSRERTSLLLAPSHQVYCSNQRGLTGSRRARIFFFAFALKKADERRYTRQHTRPTIHPLHPQPQHTHHTPSPPPYDHPQPVQPTPPLPPAPPPPSPRIPIRRMFLHAGCVDLRGYWSPFFSRYFPLSPLGVVRPPILSRAN